MGAEGIGGEPIEVAIHDGEAIVQPDRRTALMTELGRLRGLRDYAAGEVVIYNQKYLDEIKSQFGDDNPIIFTKEPPIEALKLRAVWAQSVKRPLREIAINQCVGRMTWIEGGVTHSDGEKIIPGVYIHTFIRDLHYRCWMDRPQLESFLSGQWRFAQPDECGSLLRPSWDIGPAHREMG
jgi:hypothetical protein